MKLQTIGHASLCLRNDNHEPILLTDPWLIGSCYWRSWWLQNYPTHDLVEELTKVKYCYITHEHPDHYHTPSIRKLGNKPIYLAPLLPQENIKAFLTEQGLKAENITPLTWKQIDTNVEILSIPLFNDDSVLLINTPKSLIINLNDSKPRPYQLRQLRKFITDSFGNTKKIILLSSYSPASIVNNFREDGKVVSMKDKKEYVMYLNEVCNALAADFFIPFASQVIFYRPDTKWANEYKVSYEDLTKYWDNSAKLLRAYTTIDLDTFAFEEIMPNAYLHNPATIYPKVETQTQAEAQAVFTEEDREALRKKFNGNRWYLWALFPKGIGFMLDNEVKISYSAWTGKITDGIKKPSFSLQIPTQALKDALMFEHFADLGITMFTLVILNQKINIKLIYLFFLLITLHDYRHTVSFSNFFKWLSNSLKLSSWKIPAPQLKSANIA
jgi:hypothetical protein